MLPQTTYLRAVFLVFILAISIFSKAQNYDVNGRVLNENNEVLEFASVVLVNQLDTSQILFSLSDKLGTYKFKDVPVGSHSLQILYNGYEFVSKDVNVEGPTDLGDINLLPSGITLKEAMVVAKKIPMVFKGDTIVYNPNSFKTKTNATVEDMLKKLPGVQVMKDGTVRAQGENVVKVLVNGKEFFGDDPTKATKNIDASAVDKVEILERKTDEARFKGVDDGAREKVINLVLKEDANKGYFGKLEVGAGTSETYRGKLVLNKFNEDNQYTFIGNLNNLNQNGFDWREYYRMLGGSNGVQLGQQTWWFSQNDWLGQNQEGRQTNAVLGANANFKIGKKGTLNTSYFLMDRSNDLQATSTSENFIPGRSIFNNSGTNTTSDNGQHKLYTQYRLDADTLNFVTLQGEISYNSGETSSDGFSINENSEASLLNHSLSQLRDVNSNLNYKAKGSFIRKFKKKRHVFTIESGFQRNDASDTSSWANRIEPTSLDNSTRLLPEYSDDKSGIGSQIYAGAQLDYHLVKEHFAALRFEHKIGKDSFVQGRRFLVPDSLIPNQSPVLSSDYTSSKVRLSYSKNFEKKGWYWQMAMAVLRLEQERHLDLEGATISDFKKPYTFLMPSGHVGYMVPKKGRMSIWVNSNEVLPNMNQINPVQNIANPTRISQGNLLLDPYVSHSIGANGRRQNSSNNTFLYGYVSAGINRNVVGSRETRDSNNVSTSIPVNLKNSSWKNFNLSYQFPVTKLKLEIDLGVSYNNFNYYNLLNDQLYDNKRNTFGYSIDFEFQFDPIEIDFGYEPDFSIQKSPLFDEPISYWRHDLYSDLYVEITDRIEFNIESSVYYFNSNQLGGQQVIPVVNAGLSWGLDSLQKWELSITAYDMLKRAQNIDRNFFGNGYTETRQNTLTRYFLFSLSHTIKKGKKKQERRRRW